MLLELQHSSHLDTFYGYLKNNTSMSNTVTNDLFLCSSQLLHSFSIWIDKTNKNDQSFALIYMET